ADTLPQLRDAVPRAVAGGWCWSARSSHESWRSKRDAVEHATARRCCHVRCGRAAAITSLRSGGRASAALVWLGELERAAPASRSCRLVRRAVTSRRWACHPRFGARARALIDGRATTKARPNASRALRWLRQCRCQAPRERNPLIDAANRGV